MSAVDAGHAGYRTLLIEVAIGGKMVLSRAEPLMSARR
jgi:hypothetical protein